MDLIYANEKFEDIGVLSDYSFDLAFGSGENDFELSIPLNKACCEAGYVIYYENTEYGGIVDNIEILTQSEEVKYSGRTWHGILNSKVIEPDEGEDYLVMSGDVNAIIEKLLLRCGLSSFFRVKDLSGVGISRYKFDRYSSLYDGICKMLAKAGMKLILTFNGNHITVSAEQIVDYSTDRDIDNDEIDFKIKKVFAPINHVICLGKGELRNREILHLYANAEGNIVDNQVFKGLSEVAAVYDYSSAESPEALREGGIKKIEESWNESSVSFDFKSNNESYDVGDIIGAVELNTGLSVSGRITKKIIYFRDSSVSISYKVGE